MTLHEIGAEKSMGIGRRRKRIFAWVLTCGLLVLTGCGGQNGNAAALESQAGAEKQTDNQSGTETQAGMESQGGNEEGQTETENQAETESQTGAETGNQGGTGSRAENQAGTESSADKGNQAGVESQSGAENQTAESGNGAAPRKVSILGDSISTFDGWIPEGYACYFPMDGDLTKVEQTWWQIALQNTGMELCVNGSSSGSTCVGDSTSTDDCRYGCGDYRIGDLIGVNGCFPDVIIVYMGTNDFMKAVPLGDNDGTRTVEEGVIENFSDAYCLMLDKLIAFYPNAEIYCCNLPAMGAWGPESGPVFVPFVNSLELTPADYGKQIAIIAEAKGCQLIDLQNCGITTENLEWYVSDGVHLNPDGMELVGSAVERAVN